MLTINMTAKGTISDQQAVVYWTHPSGELMVAPDTRMAPFRGWRRVECKTVSEIEQFSRRMAAQQFNRMRQTQAEEHLRNKPKLERIKANCRLRLAKGCISPEDERLTRRTLANMEKREEMFYRLLFAEPDLSKAHLTIEAEEAKTGMAEFSGKRRGLADHEVLPMARLAETTA